MSFWLFIFPILPLTAPSLHSLILPLLTLQHVSAFPTLFKLCLNTLHLLKLFHDHFTYPQVNMLCLHDHLQLPKGFTYSQVNMPCSCDHLQLQKGFAYSQVNMPCLHDHLQLPKGFAYLQVNMPCSHHHLQPPFTL